jgi:lysozyme family protein
MATFERAIPVILRQEGGYVNNRNDLGGTTNYGISLRYLKELKDFHYDMDGDGDLDATDIRLLTPEKAKEIYRSQWWEKYGYEQINTQEIATKIFSISVNMGPRQAHKLIQIAITYVSKVAAIPVDGVLGPRTIQAINNTPLIPLLIALSQEQIRFYLRLVDSNPSQKENFVGWVRRAIE